MARLLFKFLAVICVIFPVWLIMRKIWKKFAQNCIIEKKTNEREICLAVFILFMAGLLVLALEGTYQSPSLMLQSARNRVFSGSKINLVPFHTIRSFVRYFHWESFLVNIVGNVVMFVPWGFGVVLLWKRNQTIWRVVALSLFLTVFIETCQLFIGRSVDVDDLILNFAGSCAGAVLYFCVRKKFPQIGKLAE